MEIPYPLETGRLVLREFQTGDLAAYYSYQRLPETAQYLLGEARNYVQCMERIARFVQQRFEGPGDWATFAVELKDRPGLIGELALKWSPDGKPEGPGYATEAARAVLDLAMDSLDFRRVEARLDAPNRASAAVCERLGMEREGVLRNNMYLKGEWTSEAIYAVVR